MTITISDQNAEPWNDFRSKDVLLYSTRSMTAFEDNKKLINEIAISETLEVTSFKDGQPDLSPYSDHKHLYILPS